MVIITSFCDLRSAVYNGKYTVVMVLTPVVPANDHVTYMTAYRNAPPPPPPPLEFALVLSEFWG